MYTYKQKSQSLVGEKTQNQQRAHLLVDSLSHYEFFIVVEASKASVLCFLLLYFAVSAVTKLEKRIKI